MKSLVPAALLLAVSLLTLSCATPIAARRTSADKDAVVVRVWIEEGSTRQPVSGARVFVTSSSGGEIANVTTGADGSAMLPPSMDERGATYIFAELLGLDLTGRRWIPEARDYDLTIVPRVSSNCVWRVVP